MGNQIRFLEKELKNELKRKSEVENRIEYLENQIKELRCAVNHEAICIITGNCTAKNISDLTNELTEIITEENIIKIKHLGMKRLAYDVKGNAEGYYIDIYFKQTPDKIIEIERIFRNNDNVLKFICMRINEGE